MTDRQRARTPANAARLAVAGVIIAGGALAMAGQAGADPAVPYPTPVPSGPEAGTPAPGQPVVESFDVPVVPPVPPPFVSPPVSDVSYQVYGQGQTPGQLGYLRDIWHTFHSGNPLDALTAAPEEAPGPPPDAGPAPKLPPGFTSLTDPQSSTPALPKDPNQTGPALPPGYYPLNGPPPPGYDAPPGPDPAAPTTVPPVPPTP